MVLNFLILMMTDTFSSRCRSIDEIIFKDLKGFKGFTEIYKYIYIYINIYNIKSWPCEKGTPSSLQAKMFVQSCARSPARSRGPLPPGPNGRVPS